MKNSASESESHAYLVKMKDQRMIMNGLNGMLPTSNGNFEIFYPIYLEKAGK